jgi:hypothetical protein
MLSSVLAVLDKILTVLLVWKRSLYQKKSQGYRYELESNPSEWFSNHFSNGMYPRTSVNETSSTKTDTGSNLKS